MTRKKQPATQPTVSIICRTVNRPTLAQTIASIGEQDWPSIELVLVDATGAGLTPMEDPATNVRLNIVSVGKALSRPLAANAGLDAASGDYLLFLDDDDWIAPKHISKLMAHVLKNPSKQVVYSKTRKTSADGKLLDDIIAVPFDHTVLRRDNFIPIHAALFSAALVRAGCRFDKNLDVYEDWDFWLQCAEHTDFKQVAHIGAYYRMGGDSATMLDEHQQRYQPGHPMADARAKLLHKWRRRWTGEQWNALLGLVDQTPQLESIHSDLENAHHAINERDRKLDSLRDQSTLLTTNFSELGKSYQQLQSNHQQLGDNHQKLQNHYHQLREETLQLQSDYQQLRNETLRLQSDYQQLGDNHQKLQNHYHQLREETLQLQSDYKQLGDNHQQLQNDYQQVREEILQLQSDYQQLGDNHQQLQINHQHLRNETQQLQSDYQQLRDNHQQLQTDYLQLNLAHERLDTGVREILNSYSWRVTAPYRWVARRAVNLVKTKIPVRRLAPPTLKNQCDGEIIGEILSPLTENSVYGPEITLHAWALSPDKLVQIRIFVDDTNICDLDPIPQFESVEDAKRIGFCAACRFREIPTRQASDTAGGNRRCESHGNLVTKHHLSRHSQYLQAMAGLATKRHCD
jgi:predicted nuclease with TOPRIM domain